MIPGQNKKKYRYKLRPGYNSDILLIEFANGAENESFFEDLKASLSEIDFHYEKIEDVWMNDEVHLHANSSAGPFLLTKDIWDMAFILADDNQDGLVRLDQILSESALFEKEKVDFGDYRKGN